MSLETKKKRLILNDVIPNWLISDGIMGELTKNFNVPWKSEYTGTESQLDIAYHSRSGRKYIAPIVEYFVDENEIVLTQGEINKIAGAIYGTYKRKWEKLWELYMTQYRPLDNYDITEEVTEGIEATGTKDGKTTTSDTTTYNNTLTTTTDEDVSNQNQLYGFDSAAPSDADRSTTTDDITVTAQRTGTDSNAGTADTEQSSKDTADRTLNSHKYGNIGVSSIQRMFREEIENWKWNFMIEVFTDVDSMTTLSVY